MQWCFSWVTLCIDRTLPCTCDVWLEQPRRQHFATHPATYSMQCIKSRQRHTAAQHLARFLWDSRGWIPEQIWSENAAASALCCVVGIVQVCIYQRGIKKQPVVIKAKKQLLLKSLCCMKLCCRRLRDPVGGEPHSGLKPKGLARNNTHTHTHTQNLLKVWFSAKK